MIGAVWPLQFRLNRLAILATLTERDRIFILSRLPHWKFAENFAQNNTRFADALNSPRAEEFIYWQTEGNRATVLEQRFPMLAEKSLLRWQKETF